ncbi:hypothetical protein [Vibrio splendidus]|uniref:hypothetical protein n=1 Tax=Vibrio splendidus TaxID=29497 RepID=UPI00076ACBE1|nr:hypothetical protein [Vibrio splendidus]PHX05754.1 hypothetical protein VSPL_26950 [Vibrio splendidus]
MNKQQFLEELTDIMQLDDTIAEAAVLAELPEWDSMAYLGVISFFDMEFSIDVSVEDLKKIETVEQLIKSYGQKIEA